MPVVFDSIAKFWDRISGATRRRVELVARAHDQRWTKPECFEAYLEEDWVNLYVDARKPEVEVPSRFKETAFLVLQYGYHLHIPILDLAVTQSGVSATLSFASTPAFTYVPWTAVFGMWFRDGHGSFFLEAAPPEFLQHWAQRKTS
jgi:hypothetical protein